MKDIKEIVKTVANRYSVEYDPNSAGPKVKYKDGTIKFSDVSELEKLFPKTINDNNEWYKMNNVKGTNVKKVRMEFQDKSNEYSIDELAIMAY